MAFSKEHAIPASICPECNHRYDRAVTVTDPVPSKPGDFAICNQCGNVAVYDGLMGLRRPTLREAHFAKHSTVVQALVMSIKARRGLN